MPRGGGRGGSGFRGGGRPRPGTARIAGQEIPVEEGFDASIALRRPGELFPTREFNTFKPLSREEKADVRTYCSIRDRIRDGPLYAVLGENVRVRKQIAFGSTDQIVSDPFEQGVETYSMKYAPKKRRLPKLDEGRYSLKFFPKELWSILDPEYATTSTSTGGQSSSRAGGAIQHEKEKKRIGVAAEKAEKDLAIDDEAELSEEEVIEGPQSDQENEFEEDEDDMAGDYNAEQYFDDGGDDAGDDYDGGDGGGGGDDGMY